MTDSSTYTVNEQLGATKSLPEVMALSTKDYLAYVESRANKFEEDFKVSQAQIEA